MDWKQFFIWAYLSILTILSVYGMHRMMLLILFLVFVWRGARVALKAPDQFGFLLASGLMASIVLFIMVNLSVTLGLMPVTGLPLPFVSYGGSALIANLICCGIIMNISRHAQSPEAI